MVADIMAAGRAEGSFRPDLDPEPAATIFVGALIAFGRSSDLSSDSYQRLCAELRRFVRQARQISDAAPVGPVHLGHHVTKRAQPLQPVA